MSILIWFRNFLRPVVTSAQVIVYENGKEKDISTYNENSLHNLMASIDDLWKVNEKKPPYWFETELIEHRKCFQKAKSYIHVQCYTHDITKSRFKKPYAIPMRYRHKLFDKKHKVDPMPVGSQTWPNRLEVRFILQDHH